MRFEPRPYQQEALDALDEHLRTKENNPCVVIPTGGGKSAIIAWAIERWKLKYPPLRVCILAHRKELVGQNSEELLGMMPFASCGIFAAGLKQKDMNCDITFASIDSIFRKAADFDPFDVVIVDESHRIPVKGIGKYRDFLRGCKLQNPRMRVVGFTATPYRMTSGMICHRDHILNEVCYSANVVDLINDGFLCKLKSKVADIQPDLSDLKKSSSGDYVLKKLHDTVDTPENVQQAVQDVVKTIRTTNRKSTILFCIDIEHATHVSQELRKYNIDAPVVSAKTKSKERDRVVKEFKAGRISALCNIGVYCEGFNAKNVDHVVLLRPTLSRGLYIQMVGRGLRLHPDKEFCLISDYANCIAEHGPIDCEDMEEVRLIECAECENTFSRAVRVCPFCGWEIPKLEVEREAAEIREKKMHDVRAANLSILGSQPELVDVDSVSVHRHVKKGSPDSIKVQYRCGLSTFREWICLDHSSFAERKARAWWKLRFGQKEAETITVDEAFEDMFLGGRICEITEKIVVVKKGKYFEITGYNLRNGIKLR